MFYMSELQPAHSLPKVLTTQNQTDESLITSFEDSKPAKRTRLSSDEKRKILQLRQADTSYSDIARLVKRDVSTVWEYLQPFESTVDEAKSKLGAGASRAVDAWLGSLEPAAADGNHKPAKDLLAAVGVIKDQPDSMVAVQVNMPGAVLPRALQDDSEGESQS